jgi:hypothetical protein
MDTYSAVIPSMGRAAANAAVQLFGGEGDGRDRQGTREDDPRDEVVGEGQAKGAGQVASTVGILTMFQWAGVDPNALLREIQLPHEDMPTWDDIVRDAKAFLGRIGVP